MYERPIKDVYDLFSCYQAIHDAIDSLQLEIARAEVRGRAMRQRCVDFLKTQNCGDGFATSTNVYWLNLDSETLESVRFKHGHDIPLANEAETTDLNLVA